MAQLTAQLDTRAGSGSIILDHSSFPSGTVEVGEIGELNLEFDMRDVADNANKVFYAPSEYKVEVFDYVDDGTADGDSLFRLIDNLLLDDVVTLTLDFTTDGGYNWSEDFEFKKKDCSYGREKRSVEIESKIEIKGNQTIQSVFNANFSDVYVLNSQEGETRNCSPVYEFIKNTMGQEIAYKTYINHSFVFDGNYDSSDGEQNGVIIGDGSYDDDGDGSAEQGYIDADGRESVTDASEVLFRVGALGGCIIGSIMGYNFFVDRLYTGDSVSLTEDDVEELNIDIGKKAYRSIFVFGNTDQGGGVQENQWGRHAGAGHLIGDADGLNDSAPKSLELYFYMLELRLAQWNDGDSDFTAIDGRFLSPSGDSVVGEHKEGDNVVFVDGNDSNLGKGDVITFNINPSTGKDIEIYNYLILQASNSRFILENRLKTDVTDGENISYYVQSGVGLTENFAQDGADAYANSYGADGENIIEFKMFDIDAFDPYQSIDLDSSFPDAIANNQYRPSELTYDIMADIIECKAYQIA